MILFRGFGALHGIRPWLHTKHKTSPKLHRDDFVVMDTYWSWVRLSEYIGYRIREYRAHELSRVPLLLYCQDCMSAIQQFGQVVSRFHADMIPHDFGMLLRDVSRFCKDAATIHKDAAPSVCSCPFQLYWPCVPSNAQHSQSRFPSVSMKQC